MYKLLLIALVLAVPVQADANPLQGPIPLAGWGHDCTNWITYSDPWTSGEMCYDPNYSGGDGWMLCSTDSAVVWPGLDIELWIEMECAFTWDHTHAQIHRASLYDDIYLSFNGTSACNNGQWIITNPPAGGDLDSLRFVDDVLGLGPTRGTAIPLTWEYSLDGAGYLPMIPDGENFMFSVPLCDHYFTIRVRLDVDYHQEDGYYLLTGGNICPADPM